LAQKRCFFDHVFNALQVVKLHEDRKSPKTGVTRLEKALKMLPPIDSGKLKPSDDSLKRLKDSLLEDAHGEEWLRKKVLSPGVRGRLKTQATTAQIASIFQRIIDNKDFGLWI